MQEKPVIGKKFVDIHKIFKDKNPKLYNRLPKFIFRWIEKIVHIDGVNHYIYKWRDSFGIEWTDRAIEDFNIELSISGGENISKSGNQMIVANHPLGGFDGVALIHAVGKIRKDLIFPVNDILLKLPGLKPVLIPINKHGKNTDNIKLLDQAFSSDKILLFFPAGLVSRMQKEGIRDLEWKHTFVGKSLQYKRDIIPTYIHAYNSNFFYRLGKWRKKLGIKTNIEMIFLSSEVFKQRNSKIHIHFGEPISYQTFDKSKSKKEWAKYIKDKVYQMGIDQGFKLR